MWLTVVIFSACFLGVYDICKKSAVKQNAVLAVMLLSSFSSLVLFSPLLYSSITGGMLFKDTIFEIPAFNPQNQIYIILKSIIVQSSWLCTFFCMKHLPISIVSPIRSSAPAWTLLGAVFILGERLSFYQWLGVLIIITCLFLYSRVGKKEGISFRKDKYIWFLFLGTLLGAISALYDKVLVKQLMINKMEIQAWFSFYQFVIALILFAVIYYPNRHKTDKFEFRWTIVLTGVFLTMADFFYFYGLSCEGALISVVSVIRRSNVIISFLAGSLIFKEKNIKRKGIILIGVLIGVMILYFMK